ncbi:MAG: hypothetical protein EOM67_08295 [Spirochaetia bacterium]|nr:hypothetical protein [Spirochaetia bacterium]
MKFIRNMLALTIATLILSTSCVMQQGISLGAGQNGWATTDLSVSEFFVAVLEDFQPFSEEVNPKPILETSVDDFVCELDKAGSTSQVSALKLNDNSYFIDFTFSSLNELLKDLNKRENQSLLSLETNGNTQSLNFYLDLNNYPELTRIVPFLADENFETFGPLYNEGMSEDEYYEMISYILGEEGPSAISESVISLRLTAPKAIKSQDGGILEGKNVVRFDIHLIDILLLSAPITFSAYW